MDALLTFFIMLALYGFYQAYHDRRREWPRLLGAWVLFGLATLTKGPIGLILPVLAIVVYLLWRRDVRYLWARKWHCLCGVAAFALVRIAPMLHSRDELAVYGSQRAGYAFYWGQDIPILLTPEDLAAFISGRASASVLLKRRYLPDAQAAFGPDMHVLWRGRLGGRRLAPVSNHPDAAAGMDSAHVGQVEGR